MLLTFLPHPCPLCDGHGGEAPVRTPYKNQQTLKYLNMKSIKTIAIGLLFSSVAFGQTLPPKQASPFNVKQIHSGHSLTDPLFSNWPGQ